MDKEMNKYVWMLENFIEECRRMLDLIEKQRAKMEDNKNGHTRNN